MWFYGYHTGRKSKLENLKGLVSLQNWPLTEPLDFSIHLPSEHQTKHLEITQKRPKGMPKSCRNISFHKEMAIPCQAISQQGHKDHKPPVEKHWIYQAKNATKCAHKMPAPSGWFWVLIHVEQPKLLHASEIHTSTVIRDQPGSKLWERVGGGESIFFRWNLEEDGKTPTTDPNQIVSFIAVYLDKTVSEWKFQSQLEVWLNSTVWKINGVFGAVETPEKVDLIFS